MNIDVASYKLCEELYELSGWSGPHWWYRLHGASKTPTVFHLRSIPQEEDVPAYDLGYLLRSLPATDDLDQSKWEKVMDCGIPDGFFLAYEMDNPYKASVWRVQFQMEDEVLDSTIFSAYTPEDALCNLFIGLFENDVFESEGE